ncbi:MAG: hypothetical protein KC422_21825, partial [Trueperaceae bacterium]|nr:hypothetical protein [Trueperaceae bacterium]
MLALFLSSILSGAIATAVMIVFLYLPLLWGGLYYDTLGAVGSVFLRKIDNRSRFLGAIILFFGGIMVAFIYGWFAYMFLNGTFGAPAYLISESPVRIDLFYPVLGLVGGFGQGMFMALITGFIVTDFHPFEEYRQITPLLISFFVGHAVYG